MKPISLSIRNSILGCIFAASSACVNTVDKSGVAASFEQLALCQGHKLSPDNRNDVSDYITSQMTDTNEGFVPKSDILVFEKPLQKIDPYFGTLPGFSSWVQVNSPDEFSALKSNVEQRSKTKFNNCEMTSEEDVGEQFCETEMGPQQLPGMNKQTSEMLAKEQTLIVYYLPKSKIVVIACVLPYEQ